MSSVIKVSESPLYQTICRSATVVGWVLFNEALNGLMLLGGAILLSGLVVGNLSSSNSGNAEIEAAESVI